MKAYKKLTIFLICMVLLKMVFAFLGSSYRYFSFRDFFTSVLNTENIVSLTNESRKVAGLGELKVNSKLQVAAQKKAEDMRKKQYFSHSGTGGKMAWDFMNEAGYNYLFAGENLAINFKSAEDVTAGWLASASHKENILDERYTEIGIGVTTGRFMGVDSTIVVQMFGKPFVSSASTSKTMLRKVKNSSSAKSKSVKKYISELVKDDVASWMPFAKAHEVYAFSDAGVATKGALDIFFVYILVGCGGLFVWRFFRKKS